MVSGPRVERYFGPGACVECFDWLAAVTLKIRDREGWRTPLWPNAAQQRYARHRTRRNIILKARQLGITTWIAARFFLKTILVPGTVTLQVAHTLESAQQIFRIVQRFLEFLPEEWKDVIITSRANVREIAFALQDSRYIVDTAGNEHAGRGLTIHNLHASEAAMWPHHPAETMAALLAAVPTAGTVEIESTPRGAGGYFHQEWTRATSPATAEAAFTPHFFPWWIEEGYRMPIPAGREFAPANEDEARLMRDLQLLPEQILFRRQLRTRFGALAPQEFAETPADCFLASGNPRFDVLAIDARLRFLAQCPHWQQQFASAREIITWFDPLPGKSYIIGADVAEGLSDGDYSAAVVIDAESGLQCAELLARWPLSRFAEELARLGRRYNHAVLAVERNNHGHTVLFALQNQFGYRRLYRQASEQGESTAGWLTTSLSKPQAIGKLDQVLREGGACLCSRRLLEQCRAYSYLRDGETGALPGMHDDLVMAAGIAFAVRGAGAGPQLASIRR